jgi:phosphoenolpyruvate-protein phosphotransferase (PTS system enzyme I)
MEIFRGIAVSPGVAIAEAVVVDTEEYRIPLRTVEPAEVAGQIELLERAIAASVEELRGQKAQLDHRLGHDAADIFSWHIGVLEAASLRGQIESLVREELLSAAYAAGTVMRSYQRRFMRMDDPILAERARDVQDIERRLLRHILGESGEDLARLKRPVVLVAHDLPPSRTAQLS